MCDDKDLKQSLKYVTGREILKEEIPEGGLVIEFAEGKDLPEVRTVITIEELEEMVTPGRNDPCHCGSGIKYKRCHGEK
jgi:uncharacterized protein YecA (UPF0149 family)